MIREDVHDMMVLLLLPIAIAQWAIADQSIVEVKVSSILTGDLLYPIICPNEVVGVAGHVGRCCLSYPCGAVAIAV
jgi:hypothetical protein